MSAGAASVNAPIVFVLIPVVVAVVTRGRLGYGRYQRGDERLDLTGRPQKQSDDPGGATPSAPVPALP